MEGLLVAAVVLNSLILLGIVIGAVVVARRIWGAANAAEAALNDIRRELPPALQAARDALRGVEALTAKSERGLDRADSVLRSVERLISGIAIAEVAVKAATGTRVTAASILAGIGEALRVLRTRTDVGKEGLGNERE